MRLQALRCGCLRQERTTHLSLGPSDPPGTCGGGASEVGSVTCAGVLI